jgi:hypothetical protein
MDNYVNRKKFVVYEPNYSPGMRYKTVYSWFQAKKLCNRYGLGSQINQQRLIGFTNGSLSFWNTEECYDWVE